MSNGVLLEVICYVVCQPPHGMKVRLVSFGFSSKAELHLGNEGSAASTLSGYGSRADLDVLDVAWDSCKLPGGCLGLYGLNACALCSIPSPGLYASNQHVATRNITSKRCCPSSCLHVPFRRGSKAPAVRTCLMICDVHAALQEFAGRLSLKAGQHVLDVGCGIGGGCFLMAQQYDVYVHGVDLSVNMILVALDRAAAIETGSKVILFG